MSMMSFYRIIINLFFIIHITINRCVKIYWINRELIRYRIFWWNKLTLGTLVLNARFGAWSERTVMISLGDLVIPFRRLHRDLFFPPPFFYPYQPSYQKRDKNM